jgi:GTP cyclohydrolase I
MTPEAHLAAVLEALGYDSDPECAGTAARVLEVLRAWAPGKPGPRLETFDAPGRDPVILRDLPFHALCAHHLLPFHGTCDVAYRPATRIAGLGAFPKLLRHLAQQPQLQERLGVQLAGTLADTLDAPVVVRLRARQMCMEMRGAASPGIIETWTSRGDDSATAELRLLIGR